MKTHFWLVLLHEPQVQKVVEHHFNRCSHLLALVVEPEELAEKDHFFAYFRKGVGFPGGVFKVHLDLSIRPEYGGRAFPRLP